MVFGGYGTFGRRVVEELAHHGQRIVIAGRNKAKADALAIGLGPQHQSISTDASDHQACLSALKGQHVAINCAGPFSQFDAALLEACLESRCHYVDISDDRAYCTRVRRYGERFAERGLTAAYGCSSLPSISGALALVANEQSAAPIERMRCTLFIGNDNPKGRAAVASAAQSIGRAIEAPQGPLGGFCDPEIVPLPEPFGRRTALNFESPDYDLLPELLAAQSIVVKVSFDLQIANWLFGFLARRAPSFGRWLVPKINALGGLLRPFGTSGGAVMCELFSSDGRVIRAAIIARRDGQRMAALPCAYVADLLCRNDHCPRGAATAYELLGGRQLVEMLVDDGFELIEQ